ncbi:multidrug efflux SMR transporter [Heyndrickxia sporothermodurans]|uniref:DMT family transporter n=1 Tax=Heyndrickxia sporothermodurans TaxID=46224 RepID=UPI002DBBC88C|nr:multidrug efflux SMR transporter [Heyndrickxia sporothermodurans]MEB6548451.1 multidrug efflux SMR transporter [Heyndrickxia sporothermodurans]MED3651786.1 multidrug efflux SMR transporter [Heyndrickxia sporothermodurans]MED3654759.1 multidrug efflux SMR transporter [Heyndrickxia sporothermodurans]MED3697121.1 multidrug efflux SMR transporter [Heyndrickxia sporothermodurans]MED3781722.1 multidrug efflux SMR transporter [Heyndrickxia sporothermodurans]
MKAYIFLTISIIGEVFATAMLKMSEGFTNFLPSLAVIVGYGLSFYFISLALKTIPLSLAYAIWSGVGTALTALIGIFIWDELFSTLKLAGILLIIGGVVLLNFSDMKRQEKEAAN